jgi:hypothetical protein
MGRQIECPASVETQPQESEIAVNVLKKLQHPIALVVQGFVAGGVLFWTTQGQASPPAALPAPSAIAITAN